MLDTYERMDVHPTMCKRVKLRKTFGFCEGRWKFDRYAHGVVLYKRTAVMQKPTMAPAYRLTKRCAEECLWEDHGDPANYRLEERRKVGAFFGIDPSEVCDVQGLSLHPDVAAHFSPKLKWVYFRAKWQTMRLPEGLCHHAAWDTLSDRLLTTESYCCDCMNPYNGCRSRFAQLLLHRVRQESATTSA